MKTMDEIRALIADIRDPNGRCPTEPLWVALLQKVESVVRERDEARETTRATAKALSIASDGARAEAERADRAESALAALRAATPDAMREALTEVVRRASLPIATKVSGLPSSEAECAAAVDRCARLAIDHVVEPARAALAPATPAAPAKVPCPDCSGTGIACGGANPVQCEACGGLGDVPSDAPPAALRPDPNTETGPCE